ncbi:toll/interleukin-1 receptor domain-containing protein [Phytohabitans rumicis]|uniref:TIR domain-containing protein n=1 Tax=Phytohabitans rumicis TaxID=1076125 RepID=A0A6V8LIN8_9ACTN|nr:toll/interleukin-1 receptor domain-containing protein [Phytohabitans rumicis]GFJ95420.1 hypothetical protein Prum_090620 [Phytohabitans rumicis]
MQDYPKWTMPTTSAGRKIFLSHAAYDTIVAKVLRDILGRAGVGDVFLDADDLRPGDHWLPDIRSAIVDCAAIVTVLTPQFSTRPWMAAEWACFWAAEKPTYVLRLGVALADVFEPMRASIIGDLSSRSSMTAFLDAVATGNHDNYRLATALVERAAEARVEQAAADADAQLERLVTSPEEVPDDVILALIKAGREEDLSALHERSGEPRANITRQRLHRVAQALIRAGISSDLVLPLALSIDNSNYQRDAVIAVIKGGEPLPARQAFADELYGRLSIIARRRIVHAAQDIGMPLSEKWEGIRPFGD